MRFTLAGVLILLSCSINPIRTPLKDEPLAVWLRLLSLGNVVYRGDILRLPTTNGERALLRLPQIHAVDLNRNGAWEM